MQRNKKRANQIGIRIRVKGASERPPSVRTQNRIRGTSKTAATIRKTENILKRSKIEELQKFLKTFKP